MPPPYCAIPQVRRVIGNAPPHAVDADAVAGPLRLLRAMLAAAARAAGEAAAPPPRYDEREVREARAEAHEQRDAAMRADQMRVGRLADAREMLARRAFGEPLHINAEAPVDAAAAVAAAAAADAPLLAVARQVAEAFAASNPAADVAAAASACAALFDARARAAAAAVVERPSTTIRAVIGLERPNAWQDAHAALDAAADACVRSHHVQLAAALRLPLEHDNGDVAAPDAAALPRLRGAVRGLEGAIAQLVQRCRAVDQGGGEPMMYEARNNTAAVVTAMAAVTAALNANVVA